MKKKKRWKQDEKRRSFQVGEYIDMLGVEGGVFGEGMKVEY